MARNNGKGKGTLYGSTRALGDSVADRLQALFPDSVPFEVVNEAAASMAGVAMKGMARELKKHKLTGETLQALESVEELELSRTADGRSVWFVGIPREGNVRDEHYKGSRRRRRYPSAQAAQGELGDGPFYKGIYLQFGHGSLKPQKWVDKGVKWAISRIDDVALEAIAEGWKKAHEGKS